MLTVPAPTVRSSRMCRGIRKRFCTVLRRSGVCGATHSATLPCAAFLLATVFALVALISGCTRRFYRTWADREVVQVIHEKNVYPDWQLRDFYVYPHPMSRFADPTNPDHPPMPPDDPAAWLMSPHPQKPKHVAYIEGRGYLEWLAYWDSINRRQREEQENPRTDPTKPADTGESQTSPSEQETYATSKAKEDGKRPFLINLEQAIELAVMNSREFQDSREALYLAALPVTLERFNFLPQFDASQRLLRTWAGRLSSTGKQNQWSASPTVGVSQLFSTGALLTLDLANRTVIHLTGNRKHTFSDSTFVLDLVQPLLRGGGRAVTLEPLTQSERELVYELRRFVRFNRQFFVNIAVSGPGAYYDTLLAQVELENNSKNVTAFENLLRFYEAASVGGTVSPLQVNQVRDSLLRQQSIVLASEVNYANALDQFKLLLGLPVNLDIELDDTPLKPFRDVIRRFEAIEGEYQDILRELENLESVAPPPDLRKTLEQILDRARIFQGTRQLRHIRQKWPEWVPLTQDIIEPGVILGDFFQPALLSPVIPSPLVFGFTAFPGRSPVPNRLAALFDRLRRLTDERDRYRERGEEPPAELQHQIQEVEVDIDTGYLEMALRRYEERPWELETDPIQQQRVRAEFHRQVAGVFARLLEGARAERVEEIRGQWPDLPPVMLNGVNLLDLPEEEAQNLATRTALINRLDLMNARGRVVDAWRQIAVSANSLLGVVDLRYRFDAITPVGQAKPLAFSGSRSRHELTLTTELPLVRQLERNQYRTSLINYQRERRTLMETQDLIVADIRQLIRQLRRLRLDYKIRQRTLELSYIQVAQAQEELRAPPAPGATPDFLALTNRLVGDQGSIAANQNSLFRIYVDFIDARMQLYLNMELMRLDSRGVWIDEYASSERASAGPDGNRPATDPR